MTEKQGTNSVPTATNGSENNPEDNSQVVETGVLEAPPDEEETPDRVVGLSKSGDKVSVSSIDIKHKIRDTIKNHLEPKESTAYDLTRLCIVIVAVIWFLDVAIVPESAITTQVVDLLKYIITASLGFFFGSTKSANADENMKSN